MKEKILFKKYLKSMENWDLKTALKLIKKLVKLNPNNLEYKYQQAKVYYEIGETHSILAYDIEKFCSEEIINNEYLKADLYYVRAEKILDKIYNLELKKPKEKQNYEFLSKVCALIGDCCSGQDKSRKDRKKEAYYNLSAKFLEEKVDKNFQTLEKAKDLKLEHKI